MLEFAHFQLGRVLANGQLLLNSEGKVNKMSRGHL